MIDKEKKKLNMKVQWTKFAVVTLLYLIFLYWLESWLGLIVVPFIFDVYITKKIRWQWWKDSERPVRFIMSWVDALVFALVAVYFINRRLPLREQGKLWSAHTADAPHHAAHTAHAARVRLQVVHRMAAVGLSPRKRPGQG